MELELKENWIDVETSACLEPTTFYGNLSPGLYLYLI